MVSNFLQHAPPGEIRKAVPAEIVWQIQHLKNNKSPGPDHIQNEVLKHLPLPAIKQICEIVNGIFKLKAYPSKWKEGRILLFPKSGKNLRHPENYRPITLLNAMGKLAEKIICKRLKQNLGSTIRAEQFGFRANHSSSAQPMRRIEQITRGFNERKATVGLYLDIKQAFDRVWHDGLICRLIDIKIDSALIHLIADYLSNRKLEVQIESALKGNKKIASGVPQRSILGPILFNIYINDIPHNDYLLNSSIYIFADDTLITGQSIRPEQAASYVQNNIAKLEEWLLKWRVKLNTHKCQAVLYSKKSSHYWTLPNRLKLCGQEIEWSDTVKYLGVILDKKLLFKNHIDWVRGKAIGRLKLLYPILNFKTHLDLRTALTLYKSLLRPVLTYACPAWGHAARSHIKKLQTFQNKILYMVTKLPTVTPTRDLHEAAQIETIKDYIESAAKNFYNSCKGNNTNTNNASTSNINN